VKRYNYAPSPLALALVSLAERFGDLHQGQPAVVMQDEDGPLLQREPSEGVFQLVALGEPDAAVGGRGCVERQDADVDRPAPDPSGLGVARVDEDPVSPGLKPLGLPELGQLAPGGDEGVLQRVLGGTRVAQDAQGDREEPVTDLVHQVSESVSIAVTGPLDEVSIHPRTSEPAPWWRGCPL